MEVASDSHSHERRVSRLGARPLSIIIPAHGVGGGFTPTRSSSTPVGAITPVRSHTRPPYQHEVDAARASTPTSGPARDSCPSPHRGETRTVSGWSGRDHVGPTERPSNLGPCKRLVFDSNGDLTDEEDRTSMLGPRVAAVASLVGDFGVLLYLGAFLFWIRVCWYGVQ